MSIGDTRNASARGMTVLGWAGQTSGCCTWDGPDPIYGVALPPYDPDRHGGLSVGPELFTPCASRDGAQELSQQTGRAMIYGWPINGGLSPGAMQAKAEAMARTPLWFDGFPLPRSA